jgi:hypothetical protein
MDLKSELARINAELKELESEKAMLQNLRMQKMQLLSSKIQLAGARIQNIPERFASDHPILTEAAGLAKQGAVGTGQFLQQAGQEIAPELKKLGKYLYENQMRANANKAFAASLQPGQTAYNQATGSNVTRNADGTISARRVKNVVKV